MSNSDYTLEDLLTDINADLENIESDLVTKTDAAVEDALDKASRNLKKSLEKLLKSIKKEAKTDVLNFYHDNRTLIDSDLKTLNAFVKDILLVVKEELREEIHDTEDEEDKKLLKEMRNDVVRFSRKYNHEYHKLRLKLALGNAGVAMKNLFS